MTTHEGIHKILSQMCTSIGVSVNLIDPKKEGWFLEYEWTEEQISDFTDWLANQLYKDKELRKAIMAYPRKTKAHCKKVALMFVLNYGWKTKTKKNG